MQSSTSNLSTQMSILIGTRHHIPYSGASRRGGTYINARPTGLTSRIITVITQRDSQRPLAASTSILPSFASIPTYIISNSAAPASAVIFPRTILRTRRNGFERFRRDIDSTGNVVQEGRDKYAARTGSTRKRKRRTADGQRRRMCGLKTVLDTLPTMSTRRRWGVKRDLSRESRKEDEEAQRERLQHSQVRVCRRPRAGQNESCGRTCLAVDINSIWSIVIFHDRPHARLAAVNAFSELKSVATHSDRSWHCSA
jgi:hypothetical protein